MTVAFTKATVVDGVDGITAVWGNNLSNTLETVTGSINRAATFVVAASNSSDAEKNAADYLCDGTEDQVQINQAIDAAAALTPGGGVVYLCGGTYNITGSILLKSYIQVKGAGRSTVIFITNATNADLDVFKSANEAGAASYVRLENFTINGNKASQASGTMNGVQLTYVQHSTVRDVVIFSMKGSGIVLNANCISDRIDRCRILACDSAGIKLYSCGVDNIITGNYCSANVQGVYVYTADRCSITGNHLVTNSQYGIFTEAMTNSDIIGNQCSSNGIVHISIWQNSNYNNIQGNTCRKGTGCISGLYISDVSATGNYATNNDLHDAGSGSNYSDDGTSTVTTAGNRTT